MRMIVRDAVDIGDEPVLHGDETGAVACKPPFYAGNSATSGAPPVY